MNENTRMIKKTFEELSEVDIWRKPNDFSNTIGSLILHLCGNIGQYIIASLGENPDTRERDLEFSTVDGLTTEVSGQAKAELLQKLINTIDTAKATI